MLTRKVIDWLKRLMRDECLKCGSDNRELEICTEGGIIICLDCGDVK